MQPIVKTTGNMIFSVTFSGKKAMKMALEITSQEPLLLPKPLVSVIDLRSRDASIAGFKSVV